MRHDLVDPCKRAREGSLGNRRHEDVGIVSDRQCRAGGDKPVEDFRGEQREIGGGGEDERVVAQPGEACHDAAQQGVAWGNEGYRRVIDILEEETDEDRDYYINRDTIDLLESSGADAEVVTLLRQALGGREEMDVRWEPT